MDYDIKNLRNETFPKMSVQEIFDKVEWLYLRSENISHFRNEGIIEPENKDFEVILKPGYTIEELEDVLNTIDVLYYSGYGSQEIFGVVIFKDDSWLERGEYDGSEWWSHKTKPQFSAYQKLFEMTDETGMGKAYIQYLNQL